MTQKNIIFLHGFGVLGGLQNGKAQFFNEKFKKLNSISFFCIDFNPTPKDFEFHTITGMIDRLRQYIFHHDLDSVFLIGSSQGANVALNYAHRYGGVEKLLLLAPELFYDSYSTESQLQEWEELVSAPLFHYGFGEEVLLNFGHHQDGLRYTNNPQPPAPILIIHGLNDDAIPISRSQKYAGAYSQDVSLITVEDDHFLRNSRQTMWHHTQRFFQL
ncbi:MAG: alpha/beta hydrolase [Chloroflexota bacterium]